MCATETNSFDWLSIKAGAEDVFSQATLQLLAGKVAAVNGDVRRALDIARRVVEVAERRTVLQPLSDNGMNNTPSLPKPLHTSRCFSVKTKQ